MTIVDGNKVRAGDVEDDEILGARMRTWTRRSRVPKLIMKSEILE
jgi:hypothetical protein